MTMQKFKFAIIAKGIDPEADNFEDRFSEAGCDDATISVIKRSIVIDFTREGRLIPVSQGHTSYSTSVAWA